MECAPTVRGEIKKARASNYDLSSALNEFIDNSLDAGCEKILIDVREVIDDGQRFIHKILISDDSPNGISRKNLKEIFSWTFEREREKDEIGEFGTGFKSASVNLANKLTILTIDGGRETIQAVADWHEMSGENRWAPRIMDVDRSFLESYHPFTTGTTLMLESIRHEFIQQQKGNDSFLNRLYNDLSCAYKYYLKHHPSIQITIRGVFEGGQTSDRDLPGGDRLFYFDNAPLILESRILIFKNTMSYEVFLQRDLVPYWEAIEFVEKRKNGNNILRASQAHPQKNKILLDTILFRSCTYFDEHDASLVESRGVVDIIRHHRVLASGITYRSPRSDPHVAYIRHELAYSNKWLNALLGIQFNKSNDGNIPEGDMRYTLEYIQKLHEKELIRFEKQKMGRVAIREREEDDYLDLNVTSMPPPKSSSDTVQTRVLISELPSIRQQQPVAEPSSPIRQQQPVVEQPPPIQQQQSVRRKNFTMETKLEVIKKQECRDVDFDFRLIDDVLPLDYDHKNGESSNNATDNCQALSVISHALKTRRPQVFEGYRKDPSLYILRLLNCITSSKHFIESYKSGKINIRTRDELNDREGLFHHTV